MAYTDMLQQLMMQLNPPLAGQQSMQPPPLAGQMSMQPPMQPPLVGQQTIDPAMAGQMPAPPPGPPGYQPPAPMEPFQPVNYVPEGYDAATQAYLAEMAKQRKYAMLAVLGANMMATPGNISAGWGRGVESATKIGLESRAEQRKYEEGRAKGRFDRESRGTYDAYLKRQAEIATRKEQREAEQGDPAKKTDFMRRREDLLAWGRTALDPSDQPAFEAAVNANNTDSIDYYLAKGGVKGTEEQLTPYQDKSLRLSYEQFILDYAKYLEESGRPKGPAQEMAAALGTYEAPDTNYWVEQARKEIPFEQFISGPGGGPGPGGAAPGGDKTRVDPQAEAAGLNADRAKAIAITVAEQGEEKTALELMEIEKANGNPITLEQAFGIVRQAVDQAAQGGAPGPIDSSGEAERPLVTDKPGESRSDFLKARAARMKQKYGEPDETVYDRLPPGDKRREHGLTTATTVIGDTIRNLTVPRSEEGHMEYIKKGLGLEKPKTPEEKLAWDQAMAMVQSLPYDDRQGLYDHLKLSMAPITDWPVMARQWLKEYHGE